MPARLDNPRSRPTTPEQLLDVLEREYHRAGREIQLQRAAIDRMRRGGLFRWLLGRLPQNQRKNGRR